MDLAGKTALVTGAATRIGRSVALALADKGAVVVLHYRRSQAEAEQTLDEIRRLSPYSFAVQGDLSDRDQIRGIADGARSRGPVQILVNNASLFPVDDRFFTFDMEQWDRLWTVNVLAPMLLARLLFDDKTKSDTNGTARTKTGDMIDGETDATANAMADGAIVNIVDAGLNRTRSDNFVYRMTKAALKEMTLMLAVELAPRIRVNGIGPGAILPPTKMGPQGETIRPDGSRSTKLFDDYVQRNVPLKRPGSPEIIASNVLHLLLQDFITGIILNVDGGEFL